MSARDETLESLRLMASAASFPADVARLSAEAENETGGPVTREVRRLNAWLFKLLLAGANDEEILDALEDVRGAVAHWRETEQQ